MTDRINYSNVAQPCFLVAAVSAADPTTVVTVSHDPFGVPAPPTGWPSTLPCFAVIDPDTADEEVVLVTDISGTTMTLRRPASGGSYWFGSENRSHKAGARVEHHYTAYDAFEANQHETSDAGVHGLAPGEAVVGTDKAQSLRNKTLVGPVLTGNVDLGGAVVVGSVDINAAHVNITGTDSAQVLLKVRAPAAPAGSVVQVSDSADKPRVSLDKNLTAKLTGASGFPAVDIAADTSTGTTTKPMAVIRDGAGNARALFMSGGGISLSPDGNSADPMLTVYGQQTWNANVLEYEKHNGASNVNRFEIKGDACISMKPSLPRRFAAGGDLNITHDDQTDTTSFIKCDRNTGTSTVNVFEVDGSGNMKAANFSAGPWVYITLINGAVAAFDDNPRYRVVTFAGEQRIEFAGKVAAPSSAEFPYGNFVFGQLPSGVAPLNAERVYAVPTEWANSNPPTTRLGIEPAGSMVAVQTNTNLRYKWISLYGVWYWRVW